MAAKILGECVHCADHSRPAQCFQAAHWSQLSLPSAAISRDRIIGVMLDEMADGRQKLMEHSRVGCGIPKIDLRL